MFVERPRPNWGICRSFMLLEIHGTQMGVNIQPELGDLAQLETLTV